MIKSYNVFMKKKGPKIVKAVRLSKDMIELVEKKSTKSGRPFSEVIRRAITKDLVRPKKAKDK